MKSFERQTSWTQTSSSRWADPTPDSCAAFLLETVPHIMRVVRNAVGAVELAPLSIPQFRTLVFVRDHHLASLTAVAEFLGLALPSTSKLVDLMVRTGLLSRHEDSADRRRVNLRLTAEGDALLKRAESSVRREIARTFRRFDAGELSTLHHGLNLLRVGFPGPPEPTGAHSLRQSSEPDTDS